MPSFTVPAGVRVLANYLKVETRAGKPLILVFGVLKDKDYREMIGIMSKIVTGVILVAPESIRALPPRNMLTMWRQGLGADKVSAANNIKQALKQARTAAGKDGLVCVSGSLYVVGAARKILLKA